MNTEHTYLAAEVLRPTSLNIDNQPCMLNLSSLCVDQLQNVSKDTVVMMFNNYDTSTVNILAKIDTDSRLIMTICSMMAWRYALHANTEWTNIFMMEN